MMDVNYFLDQAQNSYQQEFNDNYADVIVDLFHDYTTIITQEGSQMKIYWDDNGEYLEYFITVTN
jgi:hypothetical protein